MSLARVAALAELEDSTPVRVELDGVPVCLVRLGDTVRAVHDVCSHQYWSLSDGLVYGGGIECSLHGSTFDLATGSPDTLPATTPIPTFAVAVTGDEVHVDVADVTNGAPFPTH